MKKTLKIMAVLLVALIALTGCANINYEVKINKDGSGDVAYIYGFSKTIEISTEDMVSTTKEQAEKNGYAVEPYEDSEIAGIRATKHLDDVNKDFSLQEAFGESYIKDSEENNIKVKKGLFKTTYTQNASIDLTSMKDMAAYVTMRYTVELPTKAKTYNTETVSKDGKTLTWNLTAGEINEIQFKAETISTFGVALIVIAVVAVIVLILVLVYKKDKKATAPKTKKEVKTEKAVKTPKTETKKETKVETKKEVKAEPKAEPKKEKETKKQEEKTTESKEKSEKDETKKD